MEIITSIFSDLGVDSSIISQFVIILFAFILTHLLFLGKLKEIIETREEKTTKLEGHADEAFDRVTKMQAEYNHKINEAHQLALKDSNEKKQKLTQKYTDYYKQTEKEIGLYVDQSRQAISKEIEDNKLAYLSSADGLAEALVNKMIQ